MAYTKKVLTEAKAVIDLGVRRFHWRNADEYARDLKDAASDLMDFLRDHRSRDGYSIDIETTYEDLCIYCNQTAEDDEDTGEPLCCRKAQERWQAEEYCKLTIPEVEA